MSEPIESMTLLHRIAGILAECKNMPKNGWNDYSKYKYVTGADIVDFMRDLLVKYRVMLLPSMLESHTIPHGDKGKYCSVKINYRLFSIDDQQDYIESIFWGEASDTGDKALYKAITGSDKYFYMKTFLLAGDDDVENDNKERRSSAPLKSAKSSEPPTKPKTANPKKEATGLAIMNGRAYRYSVPPETLSQEVKDKLRLAIKSHGGLKQGDIIYCYMPIFEMADYILPKDTVPEQVSFENDKIPEFKEPDASMGQTS